MTIVDSTCRGTAHPTLLANGVVEVVSRRVQPTASIGMLILALMGVVVYYVTYFLRVANVTMNRTTLFNSYIVTTLRRMRVL